MHDDIIDCDKLRRKIPTFNYKYNSKIAVLVGDMLLSLALKSLANTNNTILKIINPTNVKNNLSKFMLLFYNAFLHLSTRKLRQKSTNQNTCSNSDKISYQCSP